MSVPHSISPGEDTMRHRGGGGTNVLADTERLGRHRRRTSGNMRTPGRHRLARSAAAIAATAAALALIVAFVVHGASGPAPARHSAPQRHGLPTTPSSYLGLYSHGVPGSYAGVSAFTTATGVKPRVIVYYSGWQEPFQAGFATRVANAGAVPLVQ